MIMEHVFIWKKGMPIHFKRVDELFHRKSARDASSVLVVSADVMALALPTNWSLFYAGKVIGPKLPTILLILDGLRRGEGILFSFYETLSSTVL